MTVTIPLYPDQFTAAPRVVARLSTLTATAWRYPTGVAALTLANQRGEIEVLPFMGQMLWAARFDGVRLGMDSQFDMPRPADTVIGTYGCLGFHSGLLANGVPGPQDSHPVHGEFPTAPMDEASIEAGADARGAYLRLSGLRAHIQGFGPHYRASPSVTLHDGASQFDWAMSVENRSAYPMPLQYMAHLNPAYVAGAEIVQPAPYSAARTQVRASVPAHVTPNPDYLALIERLAADPAAFARLPERCDPEQVFYIRDPGSDAAGLAHLLLRRPQGDGFALAYPPAQFPKLVRWIMANGDASVAAFGLPATSEPEGRTAELAKGNVMTLAPGARADFGLRFGYVGAAEAEALAHLIQTTGA